MTFRASWISMGLLAAAVALGCASKPTIMPAIAADANPSTELAETERLINEARSRQVDVLSPKNFTEAEAAFKRAEKQQEKSKSSADILESLRYSRGFLEQANSKAELAATSMKQITSARADAMAADAPNQFPKEFAKAGKELEHITKSIEDGDLSPAEKRGNDLTATYRDLEVKSVRKANLGIADNNLQAAIKDDAAKKTPKTLEVAMMKYQNAERIIQADPKNQAAIRAASEDATRESVRLSGVLAKVNAGNSENLVLQTERQRQQISSLRTEYSSTEQELQQSQQQLTQKEKQLDVRNRERVAMANRETELQKSQNISQTADDIRKKFQPAEAEVFTEDGKIKIRLKGLQFATNKATLNRKNQSILNKVGVALREVDASKITVEGHTDSTGNADSNVALSENRAQAVENYLVSNGTVAREQVSAIGMGPDKPVSDNNTARGRAENRRIDLVIEM